MQWLYDRTAAGKAGKAGKAGAKIEVNAQGEIVRVVALTKITDAGLVHLKGLTSLQELYLMRTKITDAGVAKLKEALPNCQIISDRDKEGWVKAMNSGKSLGTRDK